MGLPLHTRRNRWIRKDQKSREICAQAITSPLPNIHQSGNDPMEFRIPFPISARFVQFRTSNLEPRCCVCLSAMTRNYASGLGWNRSERGSCIRQLSSLRCPCTESFTPRDEKCRFGNVSTQRGVVYFGASIYTNQVRSKRNTCIVIGTAQAIGR